MSSSELLAKNHNLATAQAPPSVNAPPRTAGIAGPPRPALSQRWSIHWLLIGSVVALTIARLVQSFPIPVPPCGLRTLTGIPCPLCGSTRALAAWSHGKFVGAFQLNPLVAAALWALGLWIILRMLERWLRLGWAARIEAHAQSKLWLLAVLALINWVYLIFYLPK